MTTMRTEAGHCPVCARETKQRVRLIARTGGVRERQLTCLTCGKYEQRYRIEATIAPASKQPRRKGESQRALVRALLDEGAHCGD